MRTYIDGTYSSHLEKEGILVLVKLNSSKHLIVINTYNDYTTVSSLCKILINWPFSIFLRISSFCIKMLEGEHFFKLSCRLSKSRMKV